MDRVRLLDIRDTPLDVAEVLAVVADPFAGGINVFVGAVREQDEGRGVASLDYESHPSALSELRRVAESVAARFDVIGLAAVHRVGHLEIGDIAVVAAVSAAHRAEAYDASRALIDELKAEVPIWKHQHFADGTDEWVGVP